ncbi:MAG: DUF2459 domain-containing protein [Marinicellaceae bacterium]
MTIILVLSACHDLHHENSTSQRYSSYTELPDNCEGTIPIVVHWGSGWHTSLVVPNRNLKVGKYFKDFPFVEVNWGDKGFYQAGASEIKQKLAAPKAMLLPSVSVMYFVGVAENSQGWCDLYNRDITLNSTDKLLINKINNKPLSICSHINTDYGDMFQYSDARQIWVKEQDFNTLTETINQSLNHSDSGNLIDMGNAFLFNSAYSSAGRFFESNKSYFGLINTCNTWTAEVLAKIEGIKHLNQQRIYRSQPIFDFLENEIAQGNSCVKKYN